MSTLTTLQTTPERPQIKAESVDFDGKPLFRFGDSQVQLFEDDHRPGPKFPFKPERSYLPNLETPNSRLQWFKSFIAKVNVFKLNPFALDPFSQQDEPFLNINGSNFVSWLRYLNDEKPGPKLEAEAHLAEVIPGFRRFRFHSIGDRKVLLSSFSRQGGADFELPIAHLSEGQRILSILYSILYGLVGEASVVCFDEPENFVSLPEVQPWLQGLRELVEERSAQALVISHHPEVIDYLASDSAFRFDRPGGDIARVSEWVPSEIMKPSEILIREG